ncbi:MAG: hypothetical protein ABIU87_02900 [Ornithinibacter sp.]
MRDRDDDAPVEHDPTGMRDLLASLPEPGPMPADLVARITASLAQEVRGGTPCIAPSDPHAGARVFDMPPRRRSRWPLIGVAAAVVGVLGLGGIISSSVPGGLTAALNLGGGDAAGSADSAAQSAPEAGAGAGSGARAAAVVTWSGVAYDGEHLGAQAAALGTGSGLADPRTASAPAAVATAEGARSCADGLGIDPDAGLVVDVATFQGRPAAVLLVTQGNAQTAYAVERSCSAQETGLLAGPVPLTH